MENNALRYVFEYDERGEFVAGHDSLYGDHASLNEVRSYLTDSDFYENGYHLPATLAGTEIPPNPV